MNGQFDLIITGGEVVLQMHLRSGGREHGFEQYLEELQLFSSFLPSASRGAHAGPVAAALNTPWTRAHRQ